MTYFSTILNKNLWNHGLQKFVYQDKNCQHKILGHDVRRKKEYLHKAVPFIWCVYIASAGIIDRE